MNRVSAFLLQSLSIAVLAISSMATAQAADPASPVSPAAPAPATAPAAAPPIIKADAAKGEALYTNGDPARNLAACVSCHGAAGNSSIVQNPKLAAQHEAYLTKQLQNFQGLARNNPIMSPIAKALTPAEMANLSAYLATQVEKPGSAKNKATLEMGRKIYRGGIAEKNVPACAACHSPNGAGIPSQFARLAGQHQEYTYAQLINFRSGTRKNSDPMTTISKRLSDEEMQAVSDYIAGLK